MKKPNCHYCQQGTPHDCTNTPEMFKDGVELDDKANLDHPCRQTCSGWQQGYDKALQLKDKKLADAKSEIENLKNELAAWSEIEKVSGRKRHEIYALANKLKPGKYGSPPLPDIPICSMVPMAVKMHDDLCDILEARAFNEDEVCTASVGIWAAIGLCEKAFAEERDQLKAEVDRLRKVLKREFSENDELGAEFVGITMLREENKNIRTHAERLAGYYLEAIPSLRATGLNFSLVADMEKTLAEYRAEHPEPKIFEGVPGLFK